MKGRTLDEVRPMTYVNPRTGKPVSRERIRQLGRPCARVRFVTALVDGGFGLE